MNFANASLLPTARRRPAVHAMGTIALITGVAGLLGGASAIALARRRRRVRERAGMASRGRHLVILGGGFAGRNVARELARQLPLANGATDPAAAAEIILVDEQPYLLYTPMLTEAAGGVVDARHIVSPNRDLPARVTFRQARVEAIDLQTRRVTLRDASRHDGAAEMAEPDFLIPRRRWEPTS